MDRRKWRSYACIGTRGNTRFTRFRPFDVRRIRVPFWSYAPPPIRDRIYATPLGFLCPNVGWNMVGRHVGLLEGRHPRASCSAHEGDVAFLAEL